MFFVKNLCKPFYVLADISGRDEKKTKKIGIYGTREKKWWKGIQTTKIEGKDKTDWETIGDHATYEYGHVRQLIYGHCCTSEATRQEKKIMEYRDEEKIDFRYENPREEELERYLFYF